LVSFNYLYSTDHHSIGLDFVQETNPKQIITIDLLKLIFYFVLHFIFRYFSYYCK